ncbi:MAG: DUF4007 family protein [Cyanobacteriota bacterium]
MSKLITEENTFLLQINFHEKIRFSLSEASQMLKFIDERESENISNKLSELKDPSSGSGFGPNKVSALVNWLKGFEFIELDKTKGYVLTKEGKCVLDNDSEFNNEVTHYLMHYKMCKNSILWNYFITDFQSNYFSFSREDLAYSIKEAFNLKKVEDASKHITPLFNFYLDDSFYCKLLNCMENQYSFNEIELPNINIFLFCLVDWWINSSFKDDFSILRSCLVEGNQSLQSILGANQDYFYFNLSKLHQLGFIEEHISVQPYTIIRKWNDNLTTILEKAYDW